MLTDTTSYDNISIVVRQTNHNNGKCASGSAVEHLLAKEGVAGSIPVSRLKKERYQIGIVLSDCRQNAFGQHSRSVFLVFGSKSVYLINNKHFWAPLFPFLAIIFASFFRFMQANVSPTFISIRAFPIICV